MFTEYEWKVTLVHETQGFGKKHTVHAINYSDAVRKAEKMLDAKGYDSGDFTVTDIKRGTITRTEVPG